MISSRWRTATVLLWLASALQIEPAAFAQAQKLSAHEYAVRANDALKAGHPEKAIPDFEALVELEPGNVDAQANLGVLLYFRGDLANALPHLRAALQLNPNLPKQQALLGQAEAALGQTDAAKADLSAALNELTAEPKNAKLRRDVGLKLVEIDTAQDELASAAAVLKSLRESSPDDPEVLYATYRVYSDLAGQALLNLSLAAPSSAQMQQAIAHELVRVRDSQGAIASYRKAIAADPNLPGIHFELAEVLHASDSTYDRAEAEAEYKLALKQNPSDAQSAVRLGDIDFDRNDTNGALKFYQQALSVQPTNTDASLGMAHVYAERDENEKALSLLQNVIAADPGNLLAHYRLSALYRKLHRADDAKRELADYQHIKDLKDKMRDVYSSMRLATPGTPDNPVTPEKKNGAGQQP